jgi:AcrR family transcriptional regulator
MSSTSGQQLRRDAARNRELLLDAALRLFRERGQKVPSLAITQAAGLAAGTLYSHFRTREDLIKALVHRSFGIAREHARTAAASDAEAADVLRAFLISTIERRDELLLPLHGGPVTTDPETRRLRKEIRADLERVLARGRERGSIRPDVTATDIILMGALLAQPLPNADDWDTVARRQASIFIDGLRRLPANEPLPG